MPVFIQRDNKSKFVYVFGVILNEIKINRTMKFTVDMISKNSGRLGSLTKSESIHLKTPLVMNYTKVST